MLMRCSLFIFLCFLTFLRTGECHAAQNKIPPVIEFARGLPHDSGSDRNNIRTSSQVEIFGQKTLQWNWQSGDKLTFKHPIELKKEVLHTGIIYSPVFVLYVFNTIPSKLPLTIEFGKGTKVACRFTFGLDFTGWRTANIRYEDMTGAPLKEMDFFRINAPAEGEGKLFFGPIMPCPIIYQAIPMPDLQVPYLADGEDEHRGPGADRSHLKVLEIKAPGYLASKKELDDLKEIEKELTDRSIKDYLPKRKKFKYYFNKFQKQVYADFAKQSQGKYVYFGIEFAAFPSEYKKQYSKSSTNIASLMNNFVKLAALYHTKAATPEQKAELEKSTLNLYKLMKVQGWVPGHSRGSLHNTGYQLKTFAASLFLMRHVFEKAGLRQEVAELLQWLTNAKEVYLMPSNEHQSSLDYFHTFATEQLIALLLTEDINKRAYWVKTFAKSLSARLAQENNDSEDGFKYDGTAFHHYGHYPDYAWGAFEHAAKLVKLFKGTEFQISEAGHANLKRALLTARIYTNKYDLPNSLLGRHPFSKHYNTLKSPDIKNALWDLAFAGTPDGKKAVDEDCASAYLRLYENTRAVPEANIRQLKAQGIKAEKNPEGFWAMNNGGVAVLRRKKWMAVFKGYSKYVWCGEGWMVANRYGAFLSNGGMEIILAGGLDASGFRQNGWDWTRLPGTTSLHVPLDVLIAATSRGKNQHSCETFAGAVDFKGRNGVFGQKVNDAFFDLKAKKSYFCFGNRIIALGSNITSRNAHYNAETTLFQNFLKEKNSSIWMGSPEKKITLFPFEKNISPEKHSPVALGDAVGNSYFIIEGKLFVHRKKQLSEQGNTGKKTEGNFATAWLNHGVRKKNSSYHYAVLVQAGNSEVNTFLKLLKSKYNPPYKVIQRDIAAHIVYDVQTGLTGAAVFEAGAIKHPIIQEVSHEVLLMSKAEDDKFELSVCEPDLKWEYANPNTKVLLTLKGRWQVAGKTANAVITGASTEKTYLQIVCTMGKKTHVTLCKLQTK